MHVSIEEISVENDKVKEELVVQQLDAFGIINSLLHLSRKESKIINIII